MKILRRDYTLEPVKIAAEQQVNTAFGQEGLSSAPIDLEHAVKRAEARMVLYGGQSEHLSEEAQAAGVTVQELAQTIVSKTDEILARGVNRRRAIHAIRNATTVEEIAAVVASLPAPLR